MRSQFLVAHRLDDTVPQRVGVQAVVCGVDRKYSFLVTVSCWHDPRSCLHSLSGVLFFFRMGAQGFLGIHDFTNICFSEVWTASPKQRNINMSSLLAADFMEHSRPIRVNYLSLGLDVWTSISIKLALKF